MERRVEQKVPKRRNSALSGAHDRGLSTLPGAAPQDASLSLLTEARQEGEHCEVFPGLESSSLVRPHTPAGAAGHHRRGETPMTAGLAQPPSAAVGNRHPTWESVITKSWLFNGCTAPDAPPLGEIVGPAFHLADFPSGHQLFAQGEPGDRVFVIISGLVKVSCDQANGHHVVRRLLGPGDVIGELEIFDPGPRSETAHCQTLVRTAWLTRATTHRLAQQHPAVALQWLQGLTRQIRDREAEITGMLTVDVSARVARQIMLLADRFGEKIDGTVHVYHSLTRHEFAQLAGARREAVSQALAKFVERGVLITTPGGFDITDIAALRRRAQPFAGPAIPR